MTLACADPALGEALLNTLSAPAFRPYLATDLIGAEAGGALKNVIAIAAGTVIGAGLLLTLPAVTALLVINLAFGVMTRAAPQLNIFSIGFPLTLALGLVIYWISLSDFGSLFQALASDALQQLGEFALVR
mgnify:CR=1 FL=1